MDRSGDRSARMTGSRMRSDVSARFLHVRICLAWPRGSFPKRLRFDGHSRRPVFGMAFRLKRAVIWHSRSRVCGRTHQGQAGSVGSPGIAASGTTRVSEPEGRPDRARWRTRTVAVLGRAWTAGRIPARSSRRKKSRTALVRACQRCQRSDGAIGTLGCHRVVVRPEFFADPSIRARRRASGPDGHRR